MNHLTQCVFEETQINTEATIKELRCNRVKAEDWGKNNSKLGKVGGIYAFWENDKAVYVGRTKNILGRHRQHLKFKKNQSPLAVKLAKESLAKEKGGNEGKDYLLANYNNLIKSKEIRNEIEKRLKCKAIQNRIYAMEFSFFEQENILLQYTLEFFCSIELGTVVLNNDKDEKDNIKEEKDADKIYYRYLFYNSFKTS